jgi:hypothetical protein
MARGRLSLGLALLQLWFLAVVSEERYIEDTDRFPGWKGELPGHNPGQPKALSQEKTGMTVGYGENGVVRFSPDYN